MILIKKIIEFIADFFFSSSVDATIQHIGMGPFFTIIIIFFLTYVTYQSIRHYRSKKTNHIAKKFLIFDYIIYFILIGIIIVIFILPY